MKCKKNLMALAVGAMSIAALTSCGDGTDVIKVWVPSTDKTMVDAWIAEFKAEHTEWFGEEKTVEGKYDIKVVATVGEGEVKPELEKDPKAAADVFYIADDNIRPLAEAEALDPIPAATVAELVASDTQDAVDAGSINGTAYGYPYRNDNGYILYYNPNVVNAEQAKTFEGITAACAAAGAKFAFEVKSSWYLPSVLFSGGGWSEVNNDGEIETNFATSAGVAEQVQYLSQFWADNIDALDATSDAGKIALGLADTPTAGNTKYGACVIWNAYDQFVAQNEAVVGTELPTLNGKQMKTFLGYKHASVKAKKHINNDEKSTIAHAFARYMTSEDSQLERLNDQKHGVTNVDLLDEIAAVENAPHIVTLSKMAADGNTHPQAPSVTQNFWSAIEALGNKIMGGQASTAADAKAALDAVVANEGWKSVVDAE